MSNSVSARAWSLALVAVVVLAGCGPAMTPAARMVPGSRARGGTGADSGYLEVLSSKHNTIHCRHTAEGESITFGARGRGFGPYPGNFTAGGKYADDVSTGGWSFSESFTIFAAGKTLHGTLQGGSGPDSVRHRPHPFICSDRFAAGLTYTIGSKSDDAAAIIQTPHDFSESLYNL